MIRCPRCGREIDETELVVHDSACKLCDSELDETHCGCYYDDKGD